MVIADQKILSGNSNMYEAIFEVENIESVTCDCCGDLVGIRFDFEAIKVHAHRFNSSNKNGKGVIRFGESVMIDEKSGGGK